MKNNKAIWALALVAILGFALWSSQSSNNMTDQEGASGARRVKLEATADLPPSVLEQFEILVTQEGEGSKVAKAGDTISVHYTGTLTDGTKFDSSVDSGQPFSFSLGAGAVIRGWDLGIEGMKVGEKRTLTIPPELGYGASGSGSVIPPNATLIFTTELMSIN